MPENVRDPQFDELLNYLKTSRGFDFTGYKPASLTRRITKRMGDVGSRTIGEYLDYLQVHPEEFTPLFNTILINVTSFFREPPAWEYLHKEVVPRIMTDKKENESIRIWSAGCASGQEAYTLAIILAETLGLDALGQRVKIYATDVDEEALALARQATYTAKDLESVSAELRSKYFELRKDRYLVKSDIRRPVIFGRHDLTRDAPMSHLDLVVCRNTLMYFNTEIQDRILSRFEFALNDNGFLFVGKAEMMLSQAERFIGVQLKHRIFKRRVTPFPQRPAGPVPLHLENSVSDPVSESLLLDSAFETSPVAKVVLDEQGRLTRINAQARTLLGLTPQDVGRPLHDLDLLYRPTDLRAHLHQAFSELHPVRITDLPLSKPGEPSQHLDMELVPLTRKDGKAIGASIVFHDMTNQYQLQSQHEHLVQELETSGEELQTTNEELQSTNEELETTNEELQSSNEEMETMNEELQSSNEELRAVNQRLTEQSTELRNMNLFMESILQSSRTGIVVLDRASNVQKWNHKAEDMWGLRAEEAQGQHFMNLDIGLPVERLKGCIRACLSGEARDQESVVDAVNRRGKPVRCRVTCTPLVGAEGAGDVKGIIMSMEDVEP